MAAKKKTTEELLEERRQQVMQQTEKSSENWKAVKAPELPAAKPTEAPASSPVLTELLGYRVSERQKQWLAYHAEQQGITLTLMLEDLVNARYGNPPENWVAPSHLRKKRKSRRGHR